MFSWREHVAHGSASNLRACLTGTCLHWRSTVKVSPSANLADTGSLRVKGCCNRQFYSSFLLFFSSPKPQKSYSARGKHYLEGFLLQPVIRQQLLQCYPNSAIASWQTGGVRRPHGTFCFTTQVQQSGFVLYCTAGYLDTP